MTGDFWHPSALLLPSKGRGQPPHCSAAHGISTWPRGFRRICPWIDRLVLIMHAREALCEPPNREIEQVDDRWHAAATRLQLMRRLRGRGWAVDDLTAVTGRMKELRNLGVHGADAVLFRLGWPTVRDRKMAKGRVLPGERLASVYLREGTSPTFHAVRELAVAVWQQIDEADEDEAFERLFGTAAEA
jgi:hypothetical protein